MHPASHQFCCCVINHILPIWTLKMVTCLYLSVILTWPVISIIKHNPAGLPIVQDGLGRTGVIRCWPWLQGRVVLDVFSVQFNGRLVVSLGNRVKFMPVIRTWEIKLRGFIYLVAQSKPSKWLNQQNTQRLASDYEKVLYIRLGNTRLSV